MTDRIQKIDDLDDGKLDIYARLSEVQLLRHNEPKPGLFIAESPKVVTRALNAGYEPLSVLIEEKQIATEGCDILNRCLRFPRLRAFPQGCSCRNAGIVEGLSGIAEK